MVLLPRMMIFRGGVRDQSSEKNAFNLRDRIRRRRKFNRRGVPLPRTTTIITTTTTTTTTKRRRRRKRTMELRRDLPRLPRRHRHLHPRKATTTMREVQEVNRREGKKSRETRRKRNKQQQRRRRPRKNKKRRRRRKRRVKRRTRQKTAKKNSINRKMKRKK